jgi:16S rRNA C967 or C1407 C5-methylase (RsmB/RsmF family)
MKTIGEIKARIERLADSLKFEAEERGQFIDWILKGEAGNKVAIWMPKTSSSIVQPKNLPKWCPSWITSTDPAAEERGEIYQLDLSSVFEAGVLQAILEKPQTVIDVCAAPGGKSLYAFRHFSPQLLIANDLDPNRVKRLKSNLLRCGIENAVVCCKDVKSLAGQYSAQADVVIVDAPCSSQSLAARGAAAEGAFNKRTIELCSDKQKGILRDAAKLTAPGGYLAYMTCTYSRDENEKVIEWFLKRAADFKAVEVEFYSEYQSGLSDHNCYRLYPFSGYGAGGFTALMRRN